MADTFNKKEKEKKRLKKKQEKQRRREERKANSEGGGLEHMMAYVDAFGNIVDTPPDPDEKEKVKAENIEISVPKKEDREEDDVNKGKLDFFNDQKGYGFIKTLKGEKFFVHINNMIDNIQEGDLVTFDVEEGPKGLNAVRVKLVE